MSKRKESLLDILLDIIEMLIPVYIIYVCALWFTNKAIIVTSDGDFYSLVKYLYQNNKLCCVMSPYVKTCSTLLKKEAKEKLIFMDNLRKKLEYK